MGLQSRTQVAHRHCNRVSLFIAALSSNWNQIDLCHLFQSNESIYYRCEQAHNLTSNTDREKWEYALALQRILGLTRKVFEWESKNNNASFRLLIEEKRINLNLYIDNMIKALYTRDYNCLSYKCWEGGPIVRAIREANLRSSTRRECRWRSSAGAHWCAHWAQDEQRVV